jgi:glycosyltransferase involved in cell wall biosynthesis
MLTRIWHRFRLPLYADLLAGGVDVFYAPDFVLPPLCRAPGVITVHDLSYRLFPETFPASLRSYLDAVVPRSVGRAQHILADSAATQRDLVVAYDVDAERTSVLYCGVDPIFHPRDAKTASREICRQHGIKPPYFLSVGTIQPRKNIARIIAGMRAVVEAGLPHHLVHVGRPGWFHEGILAAPRELDVAERVHFLTAVESDEELAVLYSGASALVFPSLYEGFGLPVLEAMASGTPVITSQTSSLPEVAGDATILVNPNDGDAIGSAMVAMATEADLRERLAAAGKERAAEFNWDRAARELRTHLERVANSHI